MEAPIVPDMSVLPKSPVKVDGQDALLLLGQVELRLAQLRQWKKDSKQFMRRMQERGESVEQAEQRVARQLAWVGERRRRLSALRAEVRRRGAALADERFALEELREELAARNLSLNEHRAELDERGTRLSQQEQLALEQKASLVQQEQELAHARAAQLAHAAELDQRQQTLDGMRNTLDTLDRELAARRVELDQRAAALDDLQMMVDGDQDRLAAAESLLKERESQLAHHTRVLEEWQREMNDRQAKQDAAALSQERTAAELEGQRRYLDEAWARLEAARRAPVSDEALRLRQEELESRARRLMHSVRSLKQQRDDLRRRRARLKHYRRLLHERVGHAPVAELDAQPAARPATPLVTQPMEELKSYLVGREQIMMRRWAIQRGGLVAASVTLLLLALLTLSLMIGYRTGSPVWGATAVAELETNLPDTRGGEGWLDALRRATAELEFAGQVEQELILRGIRFAGNRADVSQMMKRSLEISSPSPSRIAVRTTGRDAALTTALADAVAQVFVNRQQALTQQQHRAARASIVQPGARDAEPLSDQRLGRSMTIFFTALMLIATLGVAAFYTLRRLQVPIITA